MTQSLLLNAVQGRGVDLLEIFTDKNCQLLIPNKKSFFFYFLWPVCFLFAVLEIFPLFCPNLGGQLPPWVVPPWVVPPLSEPICTILMKRLIHALVPLLSYQWCHRDFLPTNSSPIAQETLNSVSLKNTSSAGGGTKSQVVVCSCLADRCLQVGWLMIMSLLKGDENLHFRED